LDQRRQQTLAHVARLAQEPDALTGCKERARMLVEEASRAWLRCWTGTLFATEVPVKTTEDLRAWCRLQQCVLDTILKAYPVHLILIDSEPQLDAALLAAVEPFFSATAQPQDLSGLAGLSRTTEDEDLLCYGYSFYARIEARLNDENIDIPTGPRPADYLRLTRYAWASARRLEQDVSRPLPKEPRPKQVRSIDSCRAWLDVIVQWCQKLDTQPVSAVTEPQQHADGPEPPRWLWWKNVRHEIHGRRAWELLNYMYDKDVMHIDEVVRDVWRNPVQDNAVSTACSRLTGRLESGLALGYRPRLRCGHEHHRTEAIPQ
jgi:hypothetical protein